MKKIFIITGRTGAGKSTLCEKLEQYFHYPIFSFASMGKSFASNNGYKRIRDCHLSMNLNEFKIKMSTYIFDIIDKQMNTCNCIIVDGLYIDDTLKRLKEKYDCYVVYLRVDDMVRYERISSRLSITLEEAKKENELKERLKDDVGIDTFIQNSDFIIDGNKSILEVCEIAKEYIKERNFL